MGEKSSENAQIVGREEEKRAMLPRKNQMCLNESENRDLFSASLEVIEAITPLVREIGCDVHVEQLPERAFDVKANVLDSSKLQADTDWSVKINFIDGLMATRDWLKSKKS